MTTPQAHERPVILVGVDESPASRAAMKWAVEHACATRAQIQAVAVWHLPPQLGDVPVLPCDRLQEEAQAWLREAIPPDCTVPVHAQVVRGDPTAVLLEHAQRAALIVLGNHGHGADPQGHLRVGGAALRASGPLPGRAGPGPIRTLGIAQGRSAGGSPSSR